MFHGWSWCSPMSMSMFFKVKMVRIRCISITYLYYTWSQGVVYVPWVYTGPPQATKNGFIRHPYAHGYASDDTSCTITRGCGDQDTASIHDAYLPLVHIGRTQCIRDMPWHTRFIILEVDGCLWPIIYREFGHWTCLCRISMARISLYLIKIRWIFTMYLHPACTLDW
jgi:hypothetical protein